MRTSRDHLPDSSLLTINSDDVGKNEDSFFAISQIKEDIERNVKE